MLYPPFKTDENRNRNVEQLSPPRPGDDEVSSAFHENAAVGGSQSRHGHETSSRPVLGNVPVDPLFLLSLSPATATTTTLNTASTTTSSAQELREKIITTIDEVLDILNDTECESLTILSNISPVLPSQ